MPRAVKSVEKAKRNGRLPSRWRTARRIAAWTLIGIGAVVALSAILIFHQPPPPVVRVDPAAAERLEAQLQRIQTDSTGTVNRVLPVDEGAVNSILKSYLTPNRIGSSDAVTVKDMRVKLTDDRVHLYVVLNAHDNDLTLEVETKMHAENGDVVFDPISAKVGALSVPRSALESALHRIEDSPVGRQQLRLPDYLSDIRVEGGKIIATFK
jgi:hypothetical protein